MVSITIALCAAFFISVYGMTIGNWINDPDFIQGQTILLNDLDKFQAPPYCIISTLMTAFTFQFYFLQVVATIEEPDVGEEHKKVLEQSYQDLF